MIENLLDLLSEKFWPNDNRLQQFFKHRIRNYFSAVNNYERTPDSDTARYQVQFRRANVISLFSSAQDYRARRDKFELVFDHIYPRLVDSVINRVNMDLQKQYFLADLLSIPMDNIHGYFYENHIPPTAYSEGILKTLLEQQANGRFSVGPAVEQQYRVWLKAADDETTEEALGRVHTYFDSTARRYFDGRTNELIQLLLDKKERNKRVHFGKECVAYYKRQTDVRDIDGFLSQDQYGLLREAFQHEPMTPAQLIHNANDFAKMFIHYCEAEVEDWWVDYNCLFGSVNKNTETTRRIFHLYVYLLSTL